MVMKNNRNEAISDLRHRVRPISVTAVMHATPVRDPCRYSYLRYGICMPGQYIPPASECTGIVGLFGPITVIAEDPATQEIEKPNYTSQNLRYTWRALRTPYARNGGSDRAVRRRGRSVASYPSPATCLTAQVVFAAHLHGCGKCMATLRSVTMGIPLRNPIAIPIAE